MMNKGLLFFALSIALISCKHDSLIETVATEIDCNTGEIAFVNKIQPIFDANCSTSGCHNAASAVKGVVLEDYAQIIETGGVSKNDAVNSNLYKRVISTGSGIMPPVSSGLSLTTLEKEEIKKWIDAGAKNTVCDEASSSPQPSVDCDSTMVSYKDDIKPLLDQSCVICHTGSSAFGNVWLDNYNDVKTWADDGALLGSIKHEVNYKNMPQGGLKWDECKIAKLANWIDEGTLNN